MTAVAQAQPIGLVDLLAWAMIGATDLEEPDDEDDLDDDLDDDDDDFVDFDDDGDEDDFDDDDDEDDEVDHDFAEDLGPVTFNPDYRPGWS